MLPRHTAFRSVEPPTAIELRENIFVGVPPPKRLQNAAANLTLNNATGEVANGELPAEEDYKRSGDDTATPMLTPLQFAIENVGKLLWEKGRGQLVFNLWISHWRLCPTVFIHWQGHAREDLLTYRKDRDKGFVNLQHDSFTLYHRKRYVLYGEHNLPTHGDHVFLDVEASSTYENVNVGTITCEGYALECWENELFFGTQEREYTYPVHTGDIPSIPAKRILRRLHELQLDSGRLGRDSIIDDDDLRDFAGNLGSSYFYPNLIYENKIQDLCSLLNLFDDFTSTSCVSIALHGHSQAGRVGIWNFLWQIILAKELARRLEQGPKWSVTGLTPHVLSTVIIADLWFRGVRIVKTDRRNEMKRKFFEVSKKAREQPTDPEAEKLKTEGNEAFERKDFNTAVSFYTQAISRCPENAVYRTNRAAVYSRQKEYVKAREDATAAVDIDPMYPKAWSWLGAARFALGEYEASLEAYEWAIEMEGAGGTEAMKSGLAKAKRKVGEVKEAALDKYPGDKRAKEKAQAEDEWAHGDIQYHSLVHEKQVEGLLLFAETLKWPYFDELRVHAEDVYTNHRNGSSIDLDTWDWIYGLSLPGKWLAYKIGKVMVSCTPSLKDMHPSPYYDAGMSLPKVSYWRLRTVLGRVLGSLTGVKSICGWVGPCPAVDGPQNKFIRLKTRRVAPKKSADNVLRSGHDGSDRSEESIRPNSEENLENWIKDLEESLRPNSEENLDSWIEDLGDETRWITPEPLGHDLTTCELRTIRLQRLPLDVSLLNKAETMSEAELDAAAEYSASIEFQLDDELLVNYTLYTNPTFITLPQCYPGPDGQHQVHQRELSKISRNVWSIRDLKDATPDEYENNGVLIINATGKGAETLARAWCSERGKSAVIRRADGPCLVCAYKAASQESLCLDVLIWVSTVNHPVQPCKICHDLCLDGALLRASLGNIERSAERGCPSCTLLRDGIARCEPLFRYWQTPPGPLLRDMDSYSINQRQGYSIHTVGATQEDIGATQEEPFGYNARVINAGYGRGCGLCLTYIYRNGPNDRLGTVIELDLFVEQGTPRSCPWKSIRAGTAISGDTASDQSFSRAIDWLQDCQTDHKTCGHTRTSPLPDRVLDLGTGGFDENRDVRLYETNNELADYVCLSYCWGSTQHLTTRSDTLEDRKAGILWDALPRTFQDAIIFTRRLKIQYLWIDSLCIVQDSWNDWSVQSSKMPSIYENSYVTLAATSSASSAGGCFSRASSRYKALEFTILDQSGKSHQVLVRGHLPHWLMANPQYRLWGCSQEFPLLDRAWVLQERLLAPRVLHFCQHELMWECMEAAACECSFLDHVETEHLDKLIHHQCLSQNANRDVVVKRWRQLVTTYSRLKLTYETDKLQALSGLARHMNKWIKDVYIAGLWKSSLPIDMLWETAAPQARPSKWLAPSWSWASVKSPVHYISGIENPRQPETHLQILETNQVAAGADDMGQLSSASVLVTAQFCVATLLVYTPLTGSTSSTGPELYIDNRLCNSALNPNAGLQCVEFEFKLDTPIGPTTQCTDPSDRDNELIGQQVLCMRVATLEPREYSLLLGCVDHAAARYERIGITSEYIGYKSERLLGRLPWNNPEKCFILTVTLV